MSAFSPSTNNPLTDSLLHTTVRAHEPYTTAYLVSTFARFAVLITTGTQTFSFNLCDQFPIRIQESEVGIDVGPIQYRLLVTGQRYPQEFGVHSDAQPQAGVDDGAPDALDFADRCEEVRFGRVAAAAA